MLARREKQNAQSAKMLYTGANFTAEECREAGMVNHVVARDELDSFTLSLVKRISARPAMGLRLAKRPMSQSLDAQDQWTAIQSALGLHHMGHAHARLVHGVPVDPDGLRRISEEVKEESSA